MLQTKEKISFPSVNLSHSKINFNSKVDINWTSSFKGFDFDGDGVLDVKDCKPFDKKRQHIKPNKLMMAELKKLPILFYGGDLSRTDVPKKIYTIDGYLMDGGKLTKAKSIPANIKKAIRRFLMVVKERPDVLKTIRQRKTWVVFTTKGDNYGFVPLSGRYAVVNLKGRTGRPFGYHKGKQFDSQENFDDFIGSDVQEGAGTIHHELEHVKQFQTSSPSKWFGSGKERKHEAQRTKEERQAHKKERKEQVRRYRYSSQKKHTQGIRSALLSMDELSGR